MFIIFCLLFLCFLKFVFYPITVSVLYIVVPGVSYGTWNSNSVTFFAGKHDCTINKDKSSHQRCSLKKSVLKNVTKFTGKHLRQSLFFNKVAGLTLDDCFFKEWRQEVTLVRLQKETSCLKANK